VGCDFDDDCGHAVVLIHVVHTTMTLNVWTIRQA
jgi:hypothetical protein